MLPLEALVAIHWVHRLFAGIVLLALLALALALYRADGGLGRSWGLGLLLLALAQLLTALPRLATLLPLVPLLQPKK